MKKVRMMLPLLAIVFAVLGAFASVDVIDDAPIRYDAQCLDCDAIDSPSVCGAPMTNYVRCQCSIPNPEGGTLVFPAKNEACDDLWKQP